MNIYKHQAANIRKTWILMGGFLIFIIGLGFVFSRSYGNPIILYGAIIISVGMNLVSFWFSDKIALAVSGAHPIEKNDDPELWNILENLSITAGLPMPRLYIINDSAPNAFATGRNKQNAAVAVTTGLRQLLDRSEMEGVIAHELSHIGNKDILISTVAVVLVGVIAMVADFFLRISAFGGGDRDNRGNAIMLIVGLVLAVLSPIAATIIQLAISRKREFLADASGSLLTRYPEGLARALEKIGAYSGHMKKANHATAHLFISSPFGEGKRVKTSWLTKLFSTHPPMEERVRILRGK